MKGHNIIGEACNGNECIQKLMNAENDPEFILMDHRMPIKNGLEAMKELLKINANLQIIFVSADKSVRSEALASGAISFIKKPFNLKTIYATIENGLANIKKE